MTHETCSCCKQQKVIVQIFMGKHDSTWQALCWDCHLAVPDFSDVLPKRKSTHENCIADKRT